MGLGIEGSQGASGDGVSNFGYERSLLGRVVFFLGLHETMLYWFRTVIKPAVDDTIFGSMREESWVDRVVMAASFSSLWWWKLKNEVEALVVVAEFKRQLLMGVEMADFVGWWLYYLTVTIGMVRVVKGILWIAMVLLVKKVEGTAAVATAENDEKV